MDDKQQRPADVRPIPLGYARHVLLNAMLTAARHGDYGGVRNVAGALEVIVALPEDPQLR